MSTAYPATNPLDRIFLGIVNVVIVFAGAVVLYHCVGTSLDLPPYETAAAAVSTRGESALAMTTDNTRAFSGDFSVRHSESP
jgi:hypothetical protein